MQRHIRLLKLRLRHYRQVIEGDQVLAAVLAVFALTCCISLSLYVRGVKRDVVRDYGDTTEIADSLIDPEKYAKERPIAPKTNPTNGAGQTGTTQPSTSSTTPSNKKNTPKSNTSDSQSGSSAKLSRVVVGNLGLYDESYLGVCQYRTQVTILGSYSSVTVVEEVITDLPAKYGPYNKTTKLEFTDTSEKTYKNSNKIVLPQYEFVGLYMSLKVLGSKGEILKEDTLAFDCNSY